MLDEHCLSTLLLEHFPAMDPHEIDDAVRDIMLLDLLADDRLVVWEDSLADRRQPGLVQTFASQRRVES